MALLLPSSFSFSLDSTGTAVANGEGDGDLDTEVAYPVEDDVGELPEDGGGELELVSRQLGCMAN
jgi:hypothetical protein